VIDQAGSELSFSPNSLLRNRDLPPKTPKAAGLIREAPVTALDMPAKCEVAYRTSKGVMYNSTVEGWLDSPSAEKYRGKIQLIFTSPPFPLNRKKKYGNKQGKEYLRWLGSLATRLTPLLTRDGSIVIEVGNAWEPGQPAMSVLAVRSLLAFLEAANLHLCQQFICYNPARLPGPTEWVNVRRVRVKDSFTHVWWMSTTPNAKADNRNVLLPYSKSMKALLKRKTYNAGARPSEHEIGQLSFLADNSGAIPSNVLTFANTLADDEYMRYCKAHNLKRHPARMPFSLADFFIRFLTDENDLVLDPFAGSNTTGAVAEALGRRWIAIEPVEEYIAGSRARFVGVE
jgi:site-specific DNA-methyltransferase (cytosine-N4-specific)